MLCTLCHARRTAPPVFVRSAALHAPEGPLQQLLSALLGLGAKSWRIQSIVSLQLCGLLARRPQLARKYSPALRQLLLSGSSDDPGQSGVVSRQRGAGVGAGSRCGGTSVRLLKTGDTT